MLLSGLARFVLLNALNASIRSWTCEAGPSSSGDAYRFGQHEVDVEVRGTSERVPAQRPRDAGGGSREI